jgi:hypothetical protein
MTFPFYPTGNSRNPSPAAATQFSFGRTSGDALFGILRMGKLLGRAERSTPKL